MTLADRFNSPSPYTLTEALFLRLLGLVYLSAFASLLPQIEGLIGDHGVAPVTESLTALHNAFGLKAYFYVPTLFWFKFSNQTLWAVCILGCFSSLFILAGLWTRVSAALCFVLYLSLTTAGQPFTNFQWDALLLECGFLALFSGAPWLIWAYRLLLFRLMFESGLVKLTSHDPNWRNLHALRFHFLTQPLPTPLAYRAHHAPGWFLDSLTLLTLIIELLIPFFLFLPSRFRRIAGMLFIALQVVILLTGNYAFFNLLTLSLCLWCFADQTYLPLQRLLQRTFPAQKNFSGLSAKLANGGLAFLMLVGLLQIIAAMLPSSAKIVRTITFLIEPFEVVNSYGLFAVMTTSRLEIVFEGSNDKDHWTEYNFRFKPGDLHRELPLVAPYQPRLDWQMWFAALGNYQENPWVGTLVYRLLLNEPAVKSLLGAPPSVRPPKYIRALLYDYTFQSTEERERTGMVWSRKLLGEWIHPVSLPSVEDSKR